MDEMIFLGTLVLLIVAGLLLARRVMHRQTGRKRNHPIYRESKNAARGFRNKPHHRPATHSLMHSHSADRMQSGNDIWKTSRLKANESRWEKGVVVANRILTDSELALEEREPEAGHGLKPESYKPTGTWQDSSRSTGAKGSKR